MKKQTLYIRTYKVPIERDGDEVKEKLIELQDNMMLDKISEEIEAPMMGIPALGKKIAGFNKRQLKIAENHDRDYIKKKIITKN